jgi:ABC-2 type transport system ATP-binding protein
VSAEKWRRAGDSNLERACAQADFKTRRRGGRLAIVDSKRVVDARLDFSLPAGSFLAVVGENGAGKTTLLDLVLGFRRRTNGDLWVMDRDPETDPWDQRSRIVYLSEKIDMPGDWEAGEFLEFHRRFYERYDRGKERTLMGRLGVRYDARVGTMSAGEIRRVQIVGALATWPARHLVGKRPV